MQTEQCNILIVVGFQPFPTHFGGAFDVWERIKGLKKMGHQLTIVFTEKESPSTHALKKMREITEEIYFVPRKNQWHDLRLSKPLQVVSRKKLIDIPFKKKYDLVILEGEFVGEILLNPTLKFNKIALRVHNNEALYFKELKKSTSSLLKKIYYQSELPKIEKYSQKILEKVDRLWYISNDELQQSDFRKKSIFIPPPINNDFKEYKAVNNHQVLFVGSLFMPNNLFAIDWYLNHVHPHFLNDALYECVIVGKVKNKKQEELLTKKYHGIKKLKFFFNQKELLPFYENTKAFINPMFHGSGVKIKSIEAIVNGLPLVSTSIGAEGMGFNQEHFWKANDSESFRTQLTSIFSSSDEKLKNTIDAAQEHLRNIHYFELLQNEISTLCRK